jgi:hypothetical protein
MQLRKHIDEARGQRASNYLDVSVFSLAFVTACPFYAASQVYLAREDHHKHRTVIRWGAILLALLVCLMIEHVPDVLASLVYQYIPLAALAAEGCGTYLSHGVAGIHRLSQRAKNNNQGAG